MQNSNATPLRQKFIQFLTLRDLAERTVHAYTTYIIALAKFHHKSPDLLSPEEVHAWFFHLISKRNYAASSVNIALNAVHSFYGKFLGLTALLHTWGQNLMNHPHLHCLVTGGGLTPEGIWGGPKQSRFLFSNHAVAALFAGKFLAGLQRLRSQGKLEFHGKAVVWTNPLFWAKQIHSLHQTKWNVFAKGSVVGPDALLQYLGRYTHRVAITNARLLAIDTTHVTFRYKDYKQNGLAKDLQLTGVEFLRRLSLHILPPGFTKVRHYGLLGNNRRKKSLPAARLALASSPHRVDLSPVTVASKLVEFATCRVCGGVDFTCVGRTDSQGKFSGMIKSASRLRLRAGEPPVTQNTS